MFRGPPTDDNMIPSAIMSRSPKCLREYLEILGSPSIWEKIMFCAFCISQYMVSPGIAMMVLFSDDERCDIGTVVVMRCIISMCQCGFFVIAALAMVGVGLYDSAYTDYSKEAEEAHAKRKQIVAKMFAPIMLIVPPVEFAFGFITWAEVSKCDLSVDDYKGRNAGGSGWNPWMLAALGLYVIFCLIFVCRRYKGHRSSYPGSTGEHDTQTPPSIAGASTDVTI